MKAHVRKVVLASVLSGTLVGYAQSALADITIGAVLPLTGTSASIGEDQRRGMELAVKEVNAHGGVAGQKLDLLVEDSAGSPVTALDAARKLTQVNKVPLILGEFSSSVTIPLGQYLVKNQLVHINISGSSSDVRKIGAYSYSMIGLDDLSAQFSAKDIYGLGYRRVALIAPNGAYGQGMSEQFTKFYQGLGGKVVAKVLYTSGQSSYRRELEQLSRAKPDVYVYTSYGQDAVVLNREAYGLGLSKKTPWYGMYLTMATADSPAQYTDGQMGMEVASLGDQGQTYVTQYQQQYKESPRSTYGSYAYDGVMLAAKAFNKAGSGEPAALQKAMLEVAPSFSGVTGPLNLDADHQRQTQPYQKVKSSGGKLVSR